MWYRFDPYVSPEATQRLKPTYLEIQDGGWPPNFQALNRFNAAADFNFLRPHP